MRASRFEARHPILIRQLIIAAAFSTYLLDRDDIVWRFIKQYPNSKFLEHAFFLLATILIGVGAAMCTLARANLRPAAAHALDPANSAGPFHSLSDPFQLGEWLFDVGLASLAPLCGCVLLIAGETIRLLRPIRSLDSMAQQPGIQAASFAAATARASHWPWVSALRSEAAKWGLFLNMIVFTVTLIDRLAEVLAAASVLVWLLVNLPDWISGAATPTA